MPARPDVIEIDLSEVATADQLHAALARGLGFPDWYGGNWDAFWDAITGLISMPRRLRLNGWAGLTARLPVEAGLLKHCLDDMTRAFPTDAPVVEYK